MSVDMNPVTYTTTQHMCSGRIIRMTDEGTANYEVFLYDTPLGEFNGPIYCTSIYPMNADNRYNKDDNVKVMVSFVQGGPEGKIQDIASGTEAYIIGKFDDEQVMYKKVENPLTPDDNSGVRFVNPESGSGVSANNDGSVNIASAGPAFIKVVPGGNGMNKDSIIQASQNFTHTVAGVNDFDTAKIHFGLNTGEDDMDAASRVTAEQKEVVYRKFVPQNSSILNWVSTCEGTFSPYMGMNNKNGLVKGSSDILYYKVVNAGNKRVTIKSGEPGKTFFSLRVDNVVDNEQSIGIGSGAITGLLGGLFSFDIGDDGGFSIRSGKGSTPGVADSNVVIEATADGELKIKASKGITLTTGDGEEKLNSVIIGDSAVEINSADSMLVNGNEVLYSSYADFISSNSSIMFNPVPPNGIPIQSPAWKMLYEAQNNAPGAIKSSGVKMPVIGANVSEDVIVTV